MATPNRLPKDFNQNAVTDIEITDPIGAAQIAAGQPIDREYPKHLHKFAGHGLMHEYVVVTSAADEAAQRKQGYGSPREADAKGRAASEAVAGETAVDVAEPAAPKVRKQRKPRKGKAGEPAAN